VLGTENLLRAVRSLNLNSKIFFASSAEIFGSPEKAPQNEQTSFNPLSPFAVSKLAAMQLCSIYRKAYGMFISNGILFDHTSEVRGEDNLTQRVAVWAAKMMLGSYEDLSVGNLNARRDWGYAKDFVNAMWLMLQQVFSSQYIYLQRICRVPETFQNMRLSSKMINFIWFVALKSSFNIFIVKNIAFKK